MTPENDYKILISNENIPVIVIKKKEGTPQNPIILYGQQEHAILYRTPNEAILLDYIAPEAIDSLSKAPYAIIMESNEDNSAISHDYKAPIRHINSNK